MAFKYTEYDDINRLADVLINAGYEDQAESALEHIFLAGEFECSVASLMYFIEHDGLKFPKDIFDGLVADYAPDSPDWDLDMYEDLLRLKSRGAVEE